MRYELFADDVPDKKSVYVYNLVVVPFVVLKAKITLQPTFIL